MNRTPLASRQRTLLLIAILHALTHVYHVALLPLYLLIQADLDPSGQRPAPVLVTILGLAYFLPSYGVGILADRFSRKALLAIGLLVNGLGFIGLSTAQSYPSATAWIILAGFGGSFFHPAATALVAQLYPVNTGRALGLIGVGASIGFFISPLYSGWRATQTGSWRDPVFDFGVLGAIMAIAFAILARDRDPTASTQTGTLPAPGTARPLPPPSVAYPNHAAIPIPSLTSPPVSLFPSRSLWVLFLMCALCFSLRDFAGGGTGTANSLFLQRAHGFDPKFAGLALSSIFLASIISNPLFGGLSDRGRIPWITLVLMLAALAIAVFPLLPVQWFIPALAFYGFFFMASYPMVEAALMESVPDSIRGRVFGLFITIGGLIANLSHWLVGRWVRALGDHAANPNAYRPLYLGLATLILLALLGLPCLRALQRREQQTSP